MTEDDFAPISENGLPEARPAATLILIRERAGAAPEILMVERASSMAFAAGALVFPGGAVDPGDHALASRLPHDLDADEAAARIAAIRETVEESGVAAGIVPAPDARTLARLRAGIDAGEDFGALLDAEGLTIDLTALAPFARWCPPARAERKRFDTHFYLARVPTEQQASVDRTENVSMMWGTVEEILRTDKLVIFPTRRNLERVGQGHDFESICAYAAGFPAEIIRPWIEDREGEPHLCIPDHLGYPVTSEALSRVKRG